MVEETYQTKHSRTYGKWSDPGVPHKGWTCVDVEDLGEPRCTCAMCETAQVRYVHLMHHPDYADELGVGCICAEHMEEDYVAPRLREAALKRRSSRRKRWLTRHWKNSRKGNAYLKIDGFLVTIFSKSPTRYRFCISSTTEDQTLWSGLDFYSEEEAKLAAFDALMEHQGLGAVV